MAKKKLIKKWKNLEGRTAKKVKAELQRTRLAGARRNGQPVPEFRKNEEEQ